MEDFDEWRKEYEDIIIIAIQKIIDKEYINEPIYYSTIDKLISTDMTYSRFVAGIRVVIDAKCKEAPNYVQLIKNVEWPIGFAAHN